VDDVPQWEYRRVDALSTGGAQLIDRLNVLGAEGWELVGFAATDRTVGFNSLDAVLRRRIVPPGPPAVTTPGWLLDPCGRWEVRYWDGTRWTAHVADRPNKQRAIDPPQTLTSGHGDPV